LICEWRSCDFKLRQKKHRFAFAVATHFKRWLQPSTNGWPLWLTKDFTAKLFVELNTQNPGRFAVGHAWNGARDRWCCAAGGAVWAALKGHGVISPHCALQRKLYRM